MTEEYTTQEAARRALDVMYGVAIANTSDKLTDKLFYFYETIAYYIGNSIPKDKKE